MSTTLTIRNLEETVKQKLRMQAASHGRSMEAEAREILTLAVTRPAPASSQAAAPISEAARNAVESVRGLWQGRGSTDEMMRELRGED
ncbi:FitA-like ribbon-helix-helix domain-containing protein [Polaromonas sp.]|uniref:FitA-like ribbon-helix-helix domain-containing protein n=1 Tax=Polaromonas sp. TaxID=1869339 RepID=UPI001A1BD63D|nr:plasmid stabilization protein [Burkholderiales bacterium]